MEQVNGETIFWLISLGLIVGLFTEFVMGKNGVGLMPNLAGGAIGTLIIGIVGIQLALPGSLLFGFLGCLAVLFLMNVFSVDTPHDSDVKIRENSST